MKALVKTKKGVGHIEVRDVPEPSPTSGEVKIKKTTRNIKVRSFLKMPPSI